ncbi:MAG: hypothetical protein JJ863_09945 [Deltaproteobacteria bacterium]|nr:hypothetical protein [Deltaproteobacteria bacterium]
MKWQLPKLIIGRDRTVDELVSVFIDECDAGRLEEQPTAPIEASRTIVTHLVAGTDEKRGRVMARCHLLSGALRRYVPQFGKPQPAVSDLEVLATLDPTRARWPLFVFGYGPSPDVLTEVASVQHMPGAEATVISRWGKLPLGKALHRRFAPMMAAWQSQSLAEAAHLIANASRPELEAALARHWPASDAAIYFRIDASTLVERLSDVPDPMLRGLATMDELSLGDLAHALTTEEERGYHL